MSEMVDMRSVVTQLGLQCDTTKNQVYIPCPVCSSNERQKKLNINFSKNDIGVFRCNKCGASGGPMALWGLYRGISDLKEAAKDYYKTAGKPVDLPARNEVVTPVDQKTADIGQRNKVYSALLDVLTLSDAHKNNLLKRGLSEEVIIKNGYKSYPKYNLEKIAQKLQKDYGCMLDGIPGFYKNNAGKWQLRELSSGFLIPQRDGKGRIEGFQIRLDEVREDCPRYISLSSRDMNLGAPSHAYCHFAPGVKGSSRIILTEGALKADIAAYLSGYSVLAVPGVNSKNYLIPALKQLSRYNLEYVLVAFDMDLYTNEHVKNALEELKKELKKIKCPFYTLKWDSTYKGIDDYLLAKVTA